MSESEALKVFPYLDSNTYSWLRTVIIFSQILPQGHCVTFHQCLRREQNSRTNRNAQPWTQHRLFSSYLHLPLPPRQQSCATSLYTFSCALIEGPAWIITLSRELSDKMGQYNASPRNGRHRLSQWSLDPEIRPSGPKASATLQTFERGRLEVISAADHQAQLLGSTLIPRKTSSVLQIFRSIKSSNHLVLHKST